MKLFLNLKLTEHIGIGLMRDKKPKKEKKESNDGCSDLGCGCFSIFLVLCLICIPISLIRSCVKGDEPTTEAATVYDEASTEEYSTEIYE